MNARRVAFGGVTLAAIATAVTAATAAARRYAKYGASGEARHSQAPIIPVAAAPRPSDRIGSSAVSTTNRVGRAARLWSLAGRSAIRRTVLSARSLGVDDARRDALYQQYTIRTAADVAAELGQMRGVLMKVGQMVSFIVESLPESTRDALSALQESGPAMDPTLAAQVILDDFNTPPGRLFASWQPVPIAAASIGQVHRATTHAGDEVAVKVQYPGVGAAIQADLANTSMLYQLVGHWFDSLNTEALVDEFQARILEELDYRLEADNQREFSAMFAGHPWVRIPRVFPELSSEHVLTSEWIEGVRLADFVGSATDEVRQRAAEVIWRFAQYSIHRHLVFNGDPHPGNFRFHRDGTVAFLDYGMVKRWQPAEWNELRPTLEAVVIDGDPERICAAMQRSGFLATDRSFDPIRTAAFVRAPYEPYLVDEFAFTPRWMSDALARSTSVGAEYADVVKALNVPPSFLILNRVVWGVNALMTKLGARGPFRAMLLEYIADGPPSTPMGVAEAKWRAHHVGHGQT